MRSTDGKVRGTDITDLSTNAYIIMCHVSRTPRPTPLEFFLSAFVMIYSTILYKYRVYNIIMYYWGSERTMRDTIYRTVTKRSTNRYPQRHAFILYIIYIDVHRDV